MAIRNPEPDSKHVDLVLTGRGYRKNFFLERDHEAKFIVIHDPGKGFLKRVSSKDYELWRYRLDVPAGDVFMTLMNVYHDVMDACAHYVVGPNGEVGQTAPEEVCAWHVGASGARTYINDPTEWCYSKAYLKPEMRWWWKKWTYDRLISLDDQTIRAVTSPAQLANEYAWRPYTLTKFPRNFAQSKAKLLSSYAKGSCNAWSIGVEVTGWSERTYKSLAHLVLDICERHNIPFRDTHILTHHDVHPLSRTDARGVPYDPREHKFTFERLKEYVDVIKKSS